MGPEIQHPTPPPLPGTTVASVTEVSGGEAEAQPGRMDPRSLRGQRPPPPARIYIPLLGPGGGREPRPIPPLGFLVLAPFLSCTHEDFFIVLSQEGTHGFGPLLRQKRQPHPASSRPPVTAVPLLAPTSVPSSQTSPKPLTGPYRKGLARSQKKLGREASILLLRAPALQLLTQK